MAKKTLCNESFLRLKLRFWMTAFIINKKKVMTFCRTFNKVVKSGKSCGLRRICVAFFESSTK